jgi:hypothetical protein
VTAAKNLLSGLMSILEVMFTRREEVYYIFRVLIGNLNI